MACWVADGSTAPVVDGIQGTTPSPSRRVDGGDSKDGETSGCSIPDLPMVRQQVILIWNCNLNFTRSTLTTLIHMIKLSEYIFTHKPSKDFF